MCRSRGLRQVWCVLAIVLAGLAMPGPAAAQEQPEAAIGPVTKLPMPRYVSLRANKVNVRRGPGLDYRIDWVFQRAGLPVRVIDEYGRWRRIADSDDAGGWVFHSLLTRHRTAVVTDAEVTLRAQPTDEARATADHLASLQLDTGMIPWYPGGHCDPWNHVETAMALDVAGLHSQAERAYEWLVDTQRPDGAWHNYYNSDGTVEETKLDTNVCAYVATGVWHHWLCTGDLAFVERMWPTVERALGFVLSLRRDDGLSVWAVEPGMRPVRASCVAGATALPAPAVGLGMRYVRTICHRESSMIFWTAGPGFLPRLAIRASRSSRFTLAHWCWLALSCA